MIIYCINLDSSKERWKLASLQFKHHKLDVTRISAVDGRSGKFATEGCNSLYNACTLSHLFTIEKAKAEGHTEILIFEDDVVLHKYFSLNLLDCYNSLPRDWDMLYLGGTHKVKPEKVNEKIYKVSHTLTSHAYLLRHTMFDAVIEKFTELEKPGDCYMTDLQKIFNCYITNPPLAWQRKGYSSINGREMDYPHLKEKLP
jgi:glycosyl transferase family 25